MKLQEYHTITNLEKIWRSLYSKNVNLSWFQSYEWNRSLERAFFAKKNTRYFGSKLKYICADDRFIAPMVVNDRTKHLTFLGFQESSDYLSFIYDTDATDEELLNWTQIILDKYKDYAVVFDRINESNRLYGIFSRLKEKNQRHCETIEKECVYVNTQVEEESFYHSLSKSIRQNYRTAVNRMTKDGLAYEVAISYQPVSGEKSLNFLDIYRQRRQDCDETTHSARLKAGVRRTVKHILGEKDLDPLTDYAESADVFTAEILINGELAAFCEGNYNCDASKVSISRVATNSKYYKYSPGQVMLIETIDKIRAHVQIFDLTRGTEEYKFKLGGVIHHNYCFEWVINP